MIFDTANNLGYYKNLGIGDRYAKAVEFLKTADLANLPVGKFEIDGDNVYYMVAEYNTIPWEETTYEAHEKYTDIQYVIKGSEIMTFAPVAALEATELYNEEKDFIHYSNANPGIKVVNGPGEYMIFKPGDGHKGKSQNGASGPVKKIVMKIKEV